MLSKLSYIIYSIKEKGKRNNCYEHIRQNQEIFVYLYATLAYTVLNKQILMPSGGICRAISAAACA